MVGVGDERRRGGVQTRGVRRGGRGNRGGDAHARDGVRPKTREGRSVHLIRSRARRVPRRARRRRSRRRARRRRTRQSPRRVTHPLRATPHGRRDAPTGIDLVSEMAAQRGGEFWMRANRAGEPRARLREPRPRPADGPVTRVAPRGGVQRRERPQFQQRRTHARAQHGGRVSEPRVHA